MAAVEDPPNSRFVGRLTVKVLRGAKLHNTHLVGKMSPYCELKIGRKKVKTNVHKKGHTDPTWGDSIDIELEGNDDQLRVKVFDQQMVGTTAIGVSRLSLKQVLGGTPKAPANESAAISSLRAQIEALQELDSVKKAAMLSLLSDGGPSVAEVWIELGSSVVPAVWVTLEKQQRAFAGQVLMAFLFISKDDARYTPVVEPGHASRNSRAQSLLLDPRRIAGQSPKQKAILDRRSSHPVVPVFPPTPISMQHTRPQGPALKLFGGTLENGVKRSKSSVPVIIFVCIQYLTHYGLDCEGLFRVPGSQSRITKLKEDFETGDSVNLMDPHDTAGVLKLYLRELAEPLIPNAFYDSFCKVPEGKEALLEQYTHLHQLCQALPVDNYNSLSFLMFFLTQVALHSDQNKMKAENLAMVFAPNLLRKSEEDQNIGGEMAQLKEMKRIKDVITLVIVGYEHVFSEGPPTPFQLAHLTLDRPQPLHRANSVHIRKPLPFNSSQPLSDEQKAELAAASRTMSEDTRFDVHRAEPSRANSLLLPAASFLPRRGSAQGLSASEGAQPGSWKPITPQNADFPPRPMRPPPARQATTTWQ